MRTGWIGDAREGRVDGERDFAGAPAVRRPAVTTLDLILTHRNEIRLDALLARPGLFDEEIRGEIGRRAAIKWETSQGRFAGSIAILHANVNVLRCRLADFHSNSAACSEMPERKT